MTWSWQYERADGSELVVCRDGLAEAFFASQGDAETWLGEIWRKLAEAGVAQVSLFEGSRKHYGPLMLSVEVAEAMA